MTVRISYDARRRYEHSRPRRLVRPALKRFGERSLLYAGFYSDVPGMRFTGLLINHGNFGHPLPSFR